MKPLLISSFDARWGAGIAAGRLHASLLQQGYESRMAVLHRFGNQAGVEQIVSGFYLRFVHRWKRRCMRFLGSLLTDGRATQRSTGLVGSGSLKSIHRFDADVLNLHYCSEEFLSIRDVSRLRKPVVWTLHDMWAFGATEHYFPEDSNQRWRKGFDGGDRPTNHRFDLDRFIWRLKRRFWNRPLRIVTPTRWLAGCVSQSALMRDWPIEVVPNTLDLEVFSPIPKSEARYRLGLPPNGKLLLFGAAGVSSDHRKGSDLMFEAVKQLSTRVENLTGIVFGRTSPSNRPDLGIPIHWTGHIEDEKRMADLYSAADITLVPSRQDNLPQTAVEAQACGCPVAAFRIGGLPEIVDHRTTGYLAQPFDIKEFAAGLEWLMSNEVKPEQLANRCRERANERWSTKVVVDRYIDVYERAKGDFERWSRDGR